MQMIYRFFFYIALAVRKKEKWFCMEQDVFYLLKYSYSDESPPYETLPVIWDEGELQSHQIIPIKLFLKFTSILRNCTNCKGLSLLKASSPLHTSHVTKCKWLRLRNGKQPLYTGLEGFLFYSPSMLNV